MLCRYSDTPAGSCAIILYSLLEARNVADVVFTHLIMQARIGKFEALKAVLGFSDGLIGGYITIFVNCSADRFLLR